MTGSAVVRQSVAVADPDTPTSVLLPNADGSLPTAGGISSTLDVVSSQVIKASPGRSYTVSVITAGSTAGTLNDCTTTGAAATSNQVGTLPNTVGTYYFHGFPHSSGIVLIPGTSQVLAISYT